MYFIPLFGLLCLIIGSIPTGYIIVRIANGSNVFHTGNGNPGLNNINGNFGVQLSVMLGIIDFVLKIIVPRFFLFAAAAYQYIEMIHDWMILYGILCVMIGNAWSIFSGFKGGRGIFLLFTSLIVLSPSSWMWVLLVPLMCRIFKIDSAPIVLLCLIPLIVYYRMDSSSLCISISLILVLLLKRVLGNGDVNVMKISTLAMRLIYDRDKKESDVEMH